LAGKSRLKSAHRDQRHHLVRHAQGAARGRLAGRRLVEMNGAAPGEEAGPFEEPQRLEPRAHVAPGKQQQRRFGGRDEAAVRAPMQSARFRVPAPELRVQPEQRIEGLWGHVRRQRQRQHEPLRSREPQPLEQIGKRRLVRRERRRLRQRCVGRVRVGERPHAPLDHERQPGELLRDSRGVAGDPRVAIDGYHSTCSGCSIHGSNTSPMPHGSASRSTS
jgi:hypothetical protein